MHCKTSSPFLHEGLVKVSDLKWDTVRAVGKELEKSPFLQGYIREPTIASHLEKRYFQKTISNFQFLYFPKFSKQNGSKRKSAPQRMHRRMTPMETECKEGRYLCESKIWSRTKWTKNRKARSRIKRPKKKGGKKENHRQNVNTNQMWYNTEHMIEPWTCFPKNHFSHAANTIACFHPQVNFVNWRTGFGHC